MEDKSLLKDLMLEKSQESFLFAIETYNKPTIKFRVEGFCFFMCNAWELLLKAYLLEKGSEITYKDKKNRSISLSNAIQKVMTNKNDPVRKNLEAVNGLRNMAAHLVIPEYALLFNDVFMACTKNYTVKLKEYFSITIDEHLSADYLTMFIPKDYSKVDIIGKYGKEVFDKYIKTKAFISHSYTENTNAKNVVNGSFALSYELTFKTVKNLTRADFTVTKRSPEKAQLGVIKVVEKIDSSQTHPYSCKQLVQLVKDEMNSKSISYEPISENAKKEFNLSVFNLLNKKFGFKNDSEYTCIHKIGKVTQYTYSIKLVGRIINIFLENPSILKDK